MAWVLCCAICLGENWVELAEEKEEKEKENEMEMQFTSLFIVPI